jgi:hypothetical protein
MSDEKQKMAERLAANIMIIERRHIYAGMSVRDKNEALKKELNLAYKELEESLEEDSG